MKIVPRPRPAPISSWMHFLKNNPQHSERFAECFWPSQVKSKDVAVKLLEKDLEWVGEKRPVFLFGGWFGTFAQILYSIYPNRYYSIDIDPVCEEVINGVLHTIENVIHDELPDITPITADMASYEYPEKPYLVINTSTEHVSQEIYDAWWKNIPAGTKYFIQGNNFFDCDEHVRCSNSLQEFIEMNHVQNCSFKNTINVGFERYNAAGIK